MENIDVLVIGTNALITVYIEGIDSRTNIDLIKEASKILQREIYRHEYHIN